MPSAKHQGPRLRAESRAVAGNTVACCPSWRLLCRLSLKRAWEGLPFQAEAAGQVGRSPAGPREGGALGQAARGEQVGPIGETGLQSRGCRRLECSHHEEEVRRATLVLEGKVTLMLRGVKNAAMERHPQARQRGCGMDSGDRDAGDGAPLLSAGPRALRGLPTWAPSLPALAPPSFSDPDAP